MKKLIPLLALAALSVSCSKLESRQNENSSPSEEDVSRVVASACDFEAGDCVLTKTEITQSGTSAPKFAWKAGDVIGVVPCNDKTIQTNFEISEIGENPAIAYFDGGDWRLKNDKQYLAYYPFQSIILTSGGSADVSFEGQIQNGDNSLAHLGDYDYMYAPPITASSLSLKFNFSHLICLIRFKVTVPVDGKYTMASIETDGECFATKARLSLSDGSFTPLVESSSLELRMEDIEASAGDEITLWLAAYPASKAASKQMTLTLFNESGSRFVSTQAITCSSLKPGKAYSYSTTVARTAPSGSVDLGLSVCWASSNLGTSLPNGRGDYYAWGDPEPYYVQQSPDIWKSSKTGGYIWETYKFCDYANMRFTKYNTDPEYGDVDGKTVLEPGDDPASVILGEHWRTPTSKEWEELLDTDKCKWASATMGSVKGFKVSSLIPGYTSNYIFIPFAGYRYGTVLYDSTAYGTYWSCDLSPEHAHLALYAYFDSSAKGVDGNDRGTGLPVRPVAL